MPHTNNPQAKARKASRQDKKKPKFLQRSKPKKASKGNAFETPAVDDEGNPIPVDPSAEAPADLLPANAAPVVDEGSRAEKVALIQEYHAIQKQLASPALTDAGERKKLLARQKELGGLEAYQAASVHGGDKKRGGESGKWCVKQLQELKVGVDKGKAKEKVEPIINADGTKTWPPKKPREKLRLLDVGAIQGTSYADWPWIETTSIDLNSGAPHVIQCDFFDFPLPAEDKKFDVVGLSLVVNFEGSLTKRADMLRHAHTYLKPTGLLYLVLPLPCLTNSRYMTHARLTSILLTCGWAPVRQHDSAKLTYWLLKRVGDGRGDGKSWKREEVRAGVHRNNFCIVIHGDGTEAVEGEDKVDSKEEMRASGEDAKEIDEEEGWGGIEVEDGAPSVAAEKEEAEWRGIEMDAAGGEDEEWGGIDA